MGWQIRRDQETSRKGNPPKGLSFDGQEISNPEELLKALQSTLPRKPRKRRNWKLIASVTLATLLLLGGTGFFTYRWFLNPKAPIDQKYVSQVPFTVFSPTRLPTGFEFKKDSVQVISDEGQKIMTYTVTNKAKSQTLNFTLQEEAKSFGYGNIRKDRAISTQYGIANIKEDEFRLVTQVSLLAQPTNTSAKTWIIITSTRQFPATALDQIIGSLKEQQK